MRSRARVGLFLVLALGLACRARKDVPAASVEARRFPLRGLVHSVDLARSEVTIAHEEIPDYMQAMTMVFEVRGGEPVLEKLRAGEAVSATLVVDGDRHWLEDVTVAPAAAGPTSPRSTDRAEVRRGTSRSPEPPGGKLPTPAVNVVTPEPNRAVSVGDLVPDFSLTDQSGKTVRLSQMRGEPVGVTFIYTRCPIATACPLTTAKFSKLDAMLRQEHMGKLFVITVEPEHDTPAVLAKYARKVGANPARWMFLTGTPREVADVASRFGVLYYPERGQVIHTQAVAVVDPRGRLATIYYGENWEPEHLLRDMRKAREE